MGEGKADIQLTQFHGNTMRNNLQAGASVVSLRSCPYFYQLGLALADKYTYYLFNSFISLFLLLFIIIISFQSFYLRIILHAYSIRMAETNGSARELPGVLSQAYKSRFPGILDKSKNWQDADFTKYTNSLDRQEQACMNKREEIRSGFF